MNALKRHIIVYDNEKHYLYDCVLITVVDKCITVHSVQCTILHPISIYHIYNDIHI